MTDKNNSAGFGRALVLSFVLIVSVVAMPLAGTAAAHTGAGASHVTLDGSSEYTTDSNAPSETVWQGQYIEVTNLGNNTEVTLRVDGGDNDGDFVKQYDTGSGTSIDIDTEANDLDGSYKVVADVDGATTEGANTVATFEVYKQDLSVETEDGDSSVNNSETGDNTVQFNLDSNRASYSFYIMEANDDFNAQDMDAIFSSGAVVNEDIDDDGDTEEVYRVDPSTGDGSASVTGDFTEINQGDYEFQFEATDSSAMASQPISVGQNDGATASLSQSVYDGEQVGDDFVFEVNTESTDEFTVTFGDEAESGYSAEATVEVDNADSSTVKMVFDTYEAGGPSKPLRVHEDSANDATITSQSNDTDLTNPLEAADYTMEVSTTGEVKDVSTVVLGERSTDGATTHVAPDVTTLNELEDVQETENLTEMSDVAMDDKFVFQVEASGLYAYMDDDSTAADLAGPDADTPGELSNNHGIHVEIEETDPAVNTEADTLDVSNGTLITDSENDQFYLVFDESDFADVEEDEEYEMSFHVREDNAYVEDDAGSDDSDTMETIEEVSSTVTFVERTADFNNMNDEDVVEVPAQAEAQVSASTTAAPGTEVTVLARSGSPNAFSMLQTVEVSEDQMINATYDMSAANVDQEFTLMVRGLTDQVDAVAVSGAPETYPVTVNIMNEAGDSVEANVSVDGQSVTTSEGSAEVSLEAGSYELTGTAEGYQDVTQTVEVTEDGENTVDVTMTAVPDTYMATVTVNSESGEAVSGASVTVDGTTKTTDSSGQAMFELENGSYTAQVSASDYQSGSQSMTVDGADTSATVTLAPPEPETFEHAVTVVDDEGSAVEGATVTVDGNSQTTNAEGQATFELESGDYDVTVEAEGYESFSDSITVESAGGSSEAALTAADAGGEGSEGEGGDSDGEGGSGGGIGMAGVVLIIAALLAGAGIIYWNRQN